ncbi:putative frv operon regulatory protein [Lactiplantibacillus pentosus]|jgi:mannitol/fructose-specific phosphotransferase system IIA component (Ntr-type)/biotin operon repressor|uniref:putative frv operon regulatory protein n=1 Tax=Lactiplantibacillus pentosus TaxID=1589 RepID=UPI0021A92BAF|nr:putative frv operon regulatory protein [Lactiplantibacillus pentosus]MCT3287341.1 HTH domain-containing protein [Lactiplantibacillus pentosus]
MLNSRELRIILLLQEHDLSGEDLATMLETSRRTVVRDIARINSLLREERIGSIESIKKYHLLVLNSANLNQLLAQSNHESNVVLLNLLVFPNITMGELTERTFMSRQNVMNCIEKINRRYKKILTIALRPRVGITVTVNHISKIDIAAALILDDRQLIAEGFKTITQSKIINIIPTIKRYLPGNVFDYLTDSQLHAQIIACILVSNERAEANKSRLYNALLEVGMSHLQAMTLTIFFDTKSQLLDRITIRQVQLAVMATKSHYTLAMLNHLFVKEIFRHLCRSAMFPTIAPASLSEQISYLKVKNPFAFDFAFDLSKKLQQSFENVQIDDEYVALYVLHAIESPTARNVRTLMYATQQSVANINKMIITQQISNLDIEMVFSKEQLETQLNYVDYNLVIGNGVHPNDLQLPINFDSTFNGVISPDELDHLKNLSNESYIQKNITSFLQANHFYHVSGKHQNVSQVLKAGLVNFSDRGLLTSEQSVSLVAREEAGNQLVLNHVSLPHASAKLSETYKIFAITFDGVLEIDNTPIYVILIVLANEKQTDSGQIFGYLYTKLKQLNDTQLQNIDDYQTLIKYLG